MNSDVATGRRMNGRDGLMRCLLERGIYAASMRPRRRVSLLTGIVSETGTMKQCERHAPRPYEPPNLILPNACSLRLRSTRGDASAVIAAFLPLSVLRFAFRHLRALLQPIEIVSRND